MLNTSDLFFYVVIVNIAYEDAKSTFIVSVTSILQVLFYRPQNEIRIGTCIYIQFTSDVFAWSNKLVFALQTFAFRTWAETSVIAVLAVASIPGGIAPQ